MASQTCQQPRRPERRCSCPKNWLVNPATPSLSRPTPAHDVVQPIGLGRSHPRVVLAAPAFTDPTRRGACPQPHAARRRGNRKFRCDSGRWAGHARPPPYNAHQEQRNAPRCTPSESVGVWLPNKSNLSISSGVKAVPVAVVPQAWQVCKGHMARLAGHSFRAPPGQGGKRAAGTTQSGRRRPTCSTRASFPNATLSRGQRRARSTRKLVSSTPSGDTRLAQGGTATPFDATSC